MPELRKKLKKMMVYLVEDSSIIRERLHDMVMELDPGATVFEAASSCAAITGIVETQPELVVLDLKLEGGSGLDVLREVNVKLPASQVIVYSNQASLPYRKKCMALGAAGFFDKAQDFELVRAKVRQIIAAATAATENGESR
ncbi:MAG: response regulator [Sulfuriferula sp.]|nr:response regulator [Sulfuriferula sp.]